MQPGSSLRFAIFTYLASCLSLPQSTATDKVDFKRDIAPILEERCWHCHGEDQQESGLRLDLRPQILKGGDSGLAAVVPGKPTKSFLLEVINHVDPDMAMPPDEDKMPAREIDLLTRWISEGAVWPGQMDLALSEHVDHWSFLPVRRPAVPGGTQAANPIDAFLMDRQASAGLSYSGPADPRSLIRRVSIVLTGLPPTPQQVDEFIKAYEADSRNAYAALVERLLASPHFGERWAQHWLDVIRWAETNGSEANLYRKNAWIYRDYVVRAFNDDKPYDRFIQEQIAGDSLGTGEATGFLVAGPHVPAATVGREPAAIRQARADRMDEIMQTVGASLMGVTVGCARCHNHKFDPLTITDYYAMTGIFQDIEFGARFPEFSEDHPRRKRGAELRKEIGKQRQILRGTGGWEENWGAFRELHFPAVTTTAVRIRFKTPNVGLDELEIFGAQNPRSNLAEAALGTAVTGFPEQGTDGRNPIDRINDGKFGTMAWRAKVPNDSPDKPWVQFEFQDPHEINRLRLSSNREYFYETDYLTQKPYLPRYQFDMDIRGKDGGWKPWVGTWLVTVKLNKDHPERTTALSKIQHQINLLAEEGPRPSFVGSFVRPAATYVLHRGSPENPRDEVAPAGPAVLNGNLGVTSEDSGPHRRLRFAKWISEAGNPLTARVMANRIWHHIFGQGIVTTTSDFGKAGAPPTHPDLLDWLAAEFVDPKVQPQSLSGADAPAAWSMKHLIRLMVMSQAFQQSAAPDAIAFNKDSTSALLWRFPPRRVEAEVIRDSILQASGKLDRRLGGRGYRIHNEKKTYAQWEVLNNHGPDTWRRMLYQERMRRVDDKMFTAFDFPDCGQVRARRPVSTTPLQALNLMNSEFVLEQSALIAERALQIAKGNEPEAVQQCFRLLLNRRPQLQELEDCLQLTNSGSLTLVCRALINSNEFVFLP